MTARVTPDPSTEELVRRVKLATRECSDEPIRMGADGAVLALAARLSQAEEHLSHIRPLRETERQVIYRQDDVLHAARRLSRSIGEINTTADLDRALKRYDEAVAADHAAALAASSAGETGE